MKKAPETSVVMSVRNGAQYIKPAIDSILRQDFTNFEFLIVNDGSTDETAEILRQQTDKRIRIFQRDAKGLPAALNFAIKESRASLIARQDADDVSEPQRLGRLLAKLAEKPRASLAHSACHFDSESGIAVPTQYVPRSQALTALSLCSRTTVVHGSAMFRKSTFDKIGGYNESFAQSQDYDLWSRMIEAGPFAYCREKLYRFRVHEKSVSSQKMEGQRAFAKKIARNNCERWFRVNESETLRIFEFLSRPANSHSTAAWLDFIRRYLPRLRYQSAELYFWAAVQLTRARRNSCKVAKHSPN